MVGQVAYGDSAITASLVEPTRASPSEADELLRAALNQGQYVLQLVRDAAEAFAEPYAKAQEVPTEGLPGEHLDVVA